jgi:NAD-dependent SIR2 family protein deacetylase
MENLDSCTELLRDCKALLIGSGAGMGVDSGLPDFRGKEGFWRAYPILKKLGLKFEEMANPRWFHEDPTLAWGFYGHRLQLYQKTHPHLGYQLVKKWTEQRFLPSFVFTSNVDGHFRKVGWSNQLLECHGSLMNLQCLGQCGHPIWEIPTGVADALVISAESMRCTSPLPSCPGCGSLARPNILMFSDFFWDSSILNRQEEQLSTWLEKNANQHLLILEFGAGLSVPTVRSFCESVKANYECGMIRVNPRDHHVPAGAYGLPCGALDAIELLNAKIETG